MRYLVVGLGNIGLKRRASLGSACVATVDPQNPAANHRDANEVDARSYDAAILAVPNRFKLELLEHFLRMGKHVLVEKPLLLPDRETARRLEELARGHRVIWYTSYNHRFEPLIAELKSQLAAGDLGRTYHTRLVYGNGTVQNIVRSWRENGLGVVEDLGSHLIDLAGFLLGCQGVRFHPWTLQRNESKCFDHAILGSTDGRIVLEASFLEWKNRFEIDIQLERGSLHLRGLPKWGLAELTRRDRVWPSGAPKETTSRFEGRDVTWGLDVEYFESIAPKGLSTVENDWWISENLRQVVA